MNAWRLVVTGTRYGRADVWQALDLYVTLFGLPYIILGGDLNDGIYSQRGVDLQAQQWAFARGCHGVVEYAFWKLEADAGPNRNARMVAHAPPGHHLLAFPDESSRGTWGCFRMGSRARLLPEAVTPGWPERLTARHRERWAA